MNILLIDPYGHGLDFAVRAQDSGHVVQLWQPKLHSGDPCSIGKGLVPLPTEWKPLMEWADLILPTANSMYIKELAPYFEKNYPICGANEKGAELELNREKGQEICERFGIETAPYKLFTDYDSAIEYVIKNNKPMVFKPCGDMNREETYVANRPREMLYRLTKLKKKGGTKPRFMLQEKIDGIEMAINAWFGPGGWGKWLEESWEEKRMMNDNKGCNTSEQGTTIRFVKKSALFEAALEPIGEYLEEIGYVGSIDMNCIIDDKGIAWPLEFTARLGWPAFNIYMPLLVGDIAGWMVDLIEGRDTMQVLQDISVGVVISFGDYPHNIKPNADYCGLPIYGITGKNYSNLHFQNVQWGEALDDNNKMKLGYLTAGNYVMVVTGTGKTVREAADNSYKICSQIDMPADVGYRTDISKRLKKELPVLQSHGYAKFMEY